MAGRGRGGRGGWRGRGGRGGARPGPGPLTDEDGAEVLGFDEGGPPKLFPDIELPPALKVSDKDKMLMMHYRDSRRMFQGGPYFLKRQQDRQRGFEDDDAADGQAPGATGGGGGGGGGGGAGAGDGKAALAFMTLDARYFPDELYTETDRRQAARGAAAAGLSFRGAPGGAPGGAAGAAGGAAPDASLSQFLSARADMEERRAAAGGGEGAAGEDEEDMIAREEEDTDTMPEEDDYYQGEHFDDDEGYDDDGDGGGGGDEGGYY